MVLQARGSLDTPSAWGNALSVRPKIGHVLLLLTVVSNMLALWGIAEPLSTFSGGDMWAKRMLASGLRYHQS